MGANEFMIEVTGETAAKAFYAATEEARYEHGHRGYTGTIAEKNGYVMVRCPEGKDARMHASQLFEERDPRVEDKWGPACCIAMGDGKYLFFGLASS